MNWMIDSNQSHKIEFVKAPADEIYRNFTSSLAQLDHRIADVNAGEVPCFPSCLAAARMRIQIALRASSGTRILSSRLPAICEAAKI